MSDGKREGNPPTNKLGISSVMIMTPTIDGKVTHGFCSSMVGSMMILQANGVNARQIALPGVSLVHDARNILAAYFLEQEEFEQLLFIDSDITWGTDSLIKILMSSGDVVGGSYPRKQPGPVVMNVGAQVGPQMPNGLVPVDHVPGGFMKIRRGVFERMIEAHPEWEYPSIGERKTWSFFDTKLQEGDRLGEDVLFCRRAIELGFKVLVDPSITLLHTGNYDYVGQLVMADDEEAPKGE